MFELQVPNVTSEEDYLYYCPSWELHVCLLMQGLLTIISARMSSKSLFGQTVPCRFASF